MNRKFEVSDPVRMVRFASILWLIYLAALAVINLSFGRPRPPGFNFDYLYYVLNGAIAVLCLGLSLWTWIQRRLKRVFLPIIIVLITVGPILVNWLMSGPFPLGSMFTPDSPFLRIFPFLFIGILIVAWQYKWQYTVLIILGITALNLGLMWFPMRTIWFYEGDITFGTRWVFQGDITMTLIQTVILLAVGFSVSYLMSSLRKQQRSLEAANVRLTHYASTLDQLATTRERNRLARELHDTLAHTLSGLSVQLETVKAYWDVDNQTARFELEKSLDAAHSGLEETRRALKALRAGQLDDLGLVMAIRTLVTEATVRAGLGLDISIADNLPAISPDVEQCIYRIVSEAVNNAVEHARAKNLTVKLELIEEKLMLSVKDDGVGFELGKSGEADKFGLAGMRERAQLVGGELNIKSEPGKGTTIELTV